MDLKFKGTKWVGNIYHKFEAICHEVDDFVSQDTVKYVENQVQTVGDSVKRFYADVVQDLIPTSVPKPGKRDAQAVCLTQNNTFETQFRSMIAFEENPAHDNINQPSVEEYPINALKNTCEHLIHPPSADRVILAESDLCLGPEVNALKDKKFDIVPEEKVTKEELVDKESDIVIEANDTEEGVMDENSHVIVEENLIHPPSADRVILAESDLCLGPEVNAMKDKKFDIVPEEKVTKEELVDKESNIVIEANDTEEGVMDENSHVIVEENGTKEEEPSQQEEFELIGTENKNLNDELLLSESMDEKNGILPEVPTATRLCSTQKGKVASISFLDDVECVSDISSMLTRSEMGSSVISCESRIPEAGLNSTSSSLSMGTYGMSEFWDENAIAGVSDLSDALSSSHSFPVLFSDNKVADVGLTFSGSPLSLESKDTSTTEDAASLAGSSANTHEYCHECAHLEVLMSSLKIGEADNCRYDITDPSMETIELSETAKPDECCVVLGHKLLYADSYRAQRRRSYKKILQDAFASKKRIRKEYEQLGILYGDIDIESIQQRLPNLLPPYSMLDSKKSSSQETWDPEWELL